MLLPTFASPRRLTLIAIVLFIAVVIFLQSGNYSRYLPKYEIPGLPPAGDGSQKSSLEQTLWPPELWGAPTTTISDPSLPATTFGSSLESAHITEAAALGTPSDSVALGPYEEVQSKIQELIRPWMRPYDDSHWPPYHDYIDKDYDPNRWEGFPWNSDFYVHNGVKKLKEEASVTVEPYLPYPEYNTASWKKAWKGSYVPCEGPRGKLLNDSDEDIVKAYPILPAGFPDVVVGDANATGIDISHCFDRHNRYGPYGYAQADRGFVLDWQRPVSKPDWTDVHWGELQDKCLLANKERYAPTARHSIELAPGKGMPNDDAHYRIDYEKAGARQTKFHTRTAVLIRSWTGYSYAENDLHAIRALVTELSLLSGAEYHVFILMNVKDKHADIFNDRQLHDEFLAANVPRELRKLTILWSEQLCEEWYPKVGDWQVYWHQYMPLQWFSQTHPEFDFVWNWETDARYTGNHYQLLEAVAQFSRNMPRKYLWERSSRFYFPSVHSTYDHFLNDTDFAIERANVESAFEPVWGPKQYTPNNQKPLGPKPPHSMKSDKFVWGVGEEADLITLQPIWDPNNTEWSYRDKIWNYVPGLRPQFTHDDPIDDVFHDVEFANIPRRVYMNTLSRFSQRQLHAMHIENLAGRTMATEMWPATVALQHGLKAVYAPHPVWTNRKWPAWYLDAVFNADRNITAQWSQQGDSVFNHDREHNFGGWSWYYNSEMPRSLYRRWLGWATTDSSPVSGAGGGGWEEEGFIAQLEPGTTARLVGGNGRMCLPPMLLHPLKNVREDEPSEVEGDQAPS